MPKYKNVKEFVQPLTINGKRIIVRPGEVVSLAKEIDLSFAPFLEKVADDTPVSHVATSTKPVAKTVVSPDLETIKQSIEELKKTTVSLEVHQLHTGTVDERLKQVEDNQSTILKRLDVLKSATETVNQALRNVEEVVYNNETFVIEDDEKDKP